MTQTTTPQETGGCGGGGGGCGCGGGGTQGVGGVDASVVQPGDLDVRTLPHERRHAEVFAAVASLAPGEGFVLAAPHDPKPLRAQLEAAEPGVLGWEYLAEGPDVWRILVSRTSCC